MTVRTRWTVPALAALVLWPLGGCADDRGELGRETNRAPVGTNASGSGTVTTTGGGPGPSSTSNAGTGTPPATPPGTTR
jgi:hypothetical protein